MNLSSGKMDVIASIAFGRSTVNMICGMLDALAVEVAGKLQSQIQIVSPWPMERSVWSKSAVRRGLIPFSRPMVSMFFDFFYTILGLDNKMKKVVYGVCMYEHQFINVVAVPYGTIVINRQENDAA